MIPINLSEISRLLGAPFEGEDRVISNISTDTRTIREDELFVPIVGERFDAHDFIADIRCGATLCERECASVSFPKLFVSSCVEALGKIARNNAEKSNLDLVVSLTGSVGKTTTKEMCALVVSEKYKTLKTEGNLNNHIGVPKTLLRLDGSVEALVCEMGMSNLGEISYLASLVDSDIAIITNVGNAHIENLKTRENIARAKLEIVEGLKCDGTLIVNGDEPLLDKVPFEGTVVRVGLSNTSDFYAENIFTRSNGVEFECVCKSGRVKVKLPIPGKHNVYNALFAMALGQCIGVKLEDCAEALESYVPTGMRQRIYQKGNSTVIADCYNAGIESMCASLEALSDMKGDKTSIAVLGDMLELGGFSEEFHKKVGEKAAETNVSVLICVGQKAKLIAGRAEECGLESVYHFDTREEAAALVGQYKDEKSIILVKASRGMELEKLIALAGLSEN